MAGIKVIIRRPLSHYVIIAAYVLAPFANIGMTAAVGSVPLELLIQNFFKGYGIFAGIWLLTAPVIGIAFFFVHKSTWYLFIAHSLLILFDFIFKWVTRPEYYMRTITPLHNLLLFLGNMALIITVGYVIQRNFKAPYFQAIQRSWREQKRIPIHHVVSVDGNAMNICDLSISGCFIEKNGKNLETDRDHMILFSAGELEIRSRGRIMRETEDGYGIMFLDLAKEDKRSISSFLKQRFALRYKVDIQAVWNNINESVPVRIVDISKGGSFIACAANDLETGDTGILEIPAVYSSERIPCRITWINREKDHKKPEGFGCAFNKPKKRLASYLIKTTGSAKLTR